MRTILLVAGLHKTGTTSIQRTCGAMHDVLASQGYIYPVGKAGNPRAAHNHTSLFHLAFRRSPGRWGPSSFDSAGDYLQHQANLRSLLAEKLARTRRDIIYVAEGVSVFDRDELAAMQAWFGDRGWSVRTFCLIRHLTPWLDSIVAQRIAAGPRITMEMVVREFMEAGSLVRNRIRNLQDVFPQTHFINFEAAARHRGGPAGHFLEMLGVSVEPDAVAAADLSANLRTSEIAVRFLSRANRRILDTRKGLMGDETLNAIRAIGKAKFVLREAEAPGLAPMLVDENEWLREEFGAAFAEERPQLSRAPIDFDPREIAALRAVCEGAPADWRPLLLDAFEETCARATS